MSTQLPVVLKTLGTELPEIKLGETRFIAARKHWYIERKTELFHSCIPTGAPEDESKTQGFHYKSPKPYVEYDVPWLAEQDKFFRWNTKFKMPYQMLREAASFFAAAYNWHHGEAALVLLLNPHTGEWRWHCPEQEIHPRGKTADIEFTHPTTLPEGFILVGDFHSHPGSGTHYSGVDDGDEVHSDGLHARIASLTHAYTNVECDFCVDKTRFKFKHSRIFEGEFDERGELILPSLPKGTTESDWVHPKEWMDKITVNEPPFRSVDSYGGLWDSPRGGSEYGTYSGSSKTHTTHSWATTESVGFALDDLLDVIQDALHKGASVEDIVNTREFDAAFEEMDKFQRDTWRQDRLAKHRAERGMAKIDEDDELDQFDIASD